MLYVNNIQYEVLGNNLYRNMSTNQVYDGDSIPSTNNIKIRGTFVGANIGNTYMPFNCDLTPLNASRFKIVNSAKDISLKKGWVEKNNFKQKSSIVDSNGRKIKKGLVQYRIVSKAKKSFTFGERFARGFLGAIAAVSIIGFMCFGVKSISDLLFKEKKNILFAVKV